MKIIILRPRISTQVPIEIDPDFSSAQVKELLISKHQFPEGTYRFLFNGTILKDPTPFSKLSDGSKVVAYVKTAPAPTPAAHPALAEQPTQNTAPQPQPARPVRANEPSGGAGVPPFAQHGGMPPRARNPEGLEPSDAQQRLVDRATMLFSTMSLLMPLEEVYNEENDFWNHPVEVGRVLHCIERNQYNASLVRHEILTTTITGQFEPFEFVDALLGIDPIAQVTDDDQAVIEELPTQQRADARSLVKEGHQPSAVLKALRDHNFNIAAARSELSRPIPPAQ